MKIPQSVLFWGAATFFAFALLGILLNVRGVADADAGMTHIAVDFAVKRPEAHSQSGFIHGMSATLPTDDRLVPLRPALWRSGTQSKNLYPRATKLGAKFTVVCSDLWGYDAAHEPYFMYPTYEERMRRIAQESQDFPIIFDLWNEPDGNGYWHGTQEQFFETFRRAHNAIRSIRPDATIAGPSLAHYDRAYCVAFLDYCLQHRLHLDVLTYHEFRAGAATPKIEATLREVRRDFLDNPKYKPLGLRAIYINETINERIQFRPASVLAVLDRLERGGADGAARACWNESDGRNNCWSNTLDGLLTMDTHQPRAVWWAYKAYADGAGRRVAGETDNQSTFVMASSARSGTSSGQILVGATSTWGRMLRPIKSTFVLKHMSAALGLQKKAKMLRLTITRIPATGEASQPTLEQARTEMVPVTDDTAHFELSLVPDEVYVITLYNAV